MTAESSTVDIVKLAISENKPLVMTFRIGNMSESSTNLSLGTYELQSVFRYDYDSEEFVVEKITIADRYKFQLLAEQPNVFGKRMEFYLDKFEPFIQSMIVNFFPDIVDKDSARPRIRIDDAQVRMLADIVGNGGGFTVCSDLKERLNYALSLEDMEFLLAKNPQLFEGLSVDDSRLEIFNDS